MKRSAMLGLGSLVVAGGAALIGYSSYRRAMAEAEDVYARLCGARMPDQKTFGASMVEGLPEIAQRYLRHAIAPGTPLYSTVTLEMEGTFLLGNRDKYQTYAMTARQVCERRTSSSGFPGCVQEQ